MNSKRKLFSSKFLLLEEFVDDDDFVAEQGIFNAEYIKSLKNKVFESSNFDQNQVWAVLAFQHWWKKFEPKHSLIKE